MKRDLYRSGGYYAICDECGFRFRANEMRLRWDGAFVCREDFEVKHPQLDLKIRFDKILVKTPRPFGSCLNDLEMLDTLVMLDSLRMGPRCLIADPITPDDL